MKLQDLTIPDLVALHNYFLSLPIATQHQANLCAVPKSAIQNGQQKLKIAAEINRRINLIEF